MTGCYHNFNSEYIINNKYDLSFVIYSPIRQQRKENGVNIASKGQCY